jgi:hypothetical protein
MWNGLRSLKITPLVGLENLVMNLSTEGREHFLPHQHLLTSKNDPTLVVQSVILSKNYLMDSEIKVLRLPLSLQEKSASADGSSTLLRHRLQFLTKQKFAMRSPRSA